MKSSRTDLFTFPGNEGRGIATSMAEALVDIATDTNLTVMATAQTLDKRNPSHRILE